MLSNVFSVFKSAKIPSEYKEYVALAQDKKLLSEPIENIRFILLDCETTGLDPKKDKVLSVAAVVVENLNLRVTNIIDLRIQQQLETAGAVEIHEITPEAAALGLPPKEAAQQLLNFIGNGVLIGQHIAFDVAVINKLFETELGIGLLNKSYDISNMVKRIDSKYANEHFNPNDLSLDKLCETYAVPIADRHTALGDCHTTALLFLKLLARLKQRKISTLNDLLKR